jgi:ATP/ADP translocase
VVIASLRSWFRRVLVVDERERPTVFWLTLYLFVSVSVFIMGRISRDALFLAHHDRRDLPWMYVTTAVTVLIPALVVARMSGRMPRDVLLQRALLITAVGTVVMRMWVHLQPAVSSLILYNFVEVYGAFLVLLFWSLASELFPARDAKRLFPLIGMGGIAAGIVCGLLVTVAMRAIGTSNLLWVQVALLLVCHAIVQRIGLIERVRLRDVRTVTTSTRDQATFASAHLRVVGMVTAATFFVVPLIDFQYKAAVQDAFRHGDVVDTDGMGQFMGMFSAATGVVAALLQVGVVGALLRRFGVVAGLLLLPLALLLGLVGQLSAVSTVFIMAVLTKGAESSLRYSVYDATMQVIYAPVPSAARGRAKAYIDGVLKPAAAATAGVLLLVVVRQLGWSGPELLWIALAFVVGWCALIMLLQRAYIRELASSLRQRRFGVGQGANGKIDDDASLTTMEAELRDTKDDDVLRALDVVSQVDLREPHSERIVAALTSCLDRGVVIQTKALHALSLAASSPAMEAAVLRCSHSEHADVRVAAFHTLHRWSSLRSPLVRGRMLEELHDEHELLHVRIVAAVALAGMSDTDGHHAVAQLQHWGGAHDDARRWVAATLADAPLSTLEQPGVTALVGALLMDADSAVRMSAHGAALVLGARAPMLRAVLWQRAGERDAQRTCLAALAAHGSDVIAEATQRASNTQESLVVRRAAVRVLEFVGSQASLQALGGLLSDDVIVADTARALARVRMGCRAAFDEQLLRAPMKAQAKRLLTIVTHVRALQQLRGRMHASTSVGALSLLEEAQWVRLQVQLDQTFRLLAIVHPPRLMETARLHLLVRGGDRTQRSRQNALELIDNLCEPHVKSWLLPILECLPEPTPSEVDQLCSAYAMAHGVQPPTSEQVLLRVAQDGSPFLAGCVAHVAAAVGGACARDVGLVLQSRTERLVAEELAGLKARAA